MLEIDLSTDVSIDLGRPFAAVVDVILDFLRSSSLLPGQFDDLDGADLTDPIVDYFQSVFSTFILTAIFLAGLAYEYRYTLMAL